LRKDSIKVVDNPSIVKDLGLNTVLLKVQLVKKWL